MVNTYGIKRNHDGEKKINVNKSVNEIHLFSVVIHSCDELLSHAFTDKCFFFYYNQANKHA